MSTAFPLPPPWSPGDSFARVEEAAIRTTGKGARKLGDGSLMLRCVNPGHEDRRASLHATWKSTEFGGRTLLHCHACGDGVDQEDWARYLGMPLDDLFDDQRWSMHNKDGQPRRKLARTRSTGTTYQQLGPLPTKIAGDLHELLGQPAPAVAPEEPVCEHVFDHVESYEYANTSGVVVHRVHRKFCPACAQKEFPQEYLTGQRWKSRKPKGFAEFLYGQDLVEQAVAGGGEVWLLEGEKDVHAAQAAGVVATTNPGGATGFQKHLAPVFAGGHVALVLDRDDAGWQRGTRVHQLLTEAGAATIRILLPLVDTAKADLSDHLDAGYTLDQLVEVPVEAVQAWYQLKALRTHLAEIKVCEDESLAQLAVAKHDTSGGRRAKAANRKRFAGRWAKEAYRAHARLIDTTLRLVKTTGAVPDNAWAAEAREIAVGVARSATTLTTSLFQTAGEIAPAELGATEDLLNNAVAAATGPVASAPAIEPQDDPGPETFDEDGPGPGWQPVVLPGGSGGGGGKITYRGVHITAPDYDVVLSGDGRLELVEIKERSRGRGEDVQFEQVFTRVLNCEVRLARKEFAEAEDALSDSNIDLEALGDRDPRMRQDTTASLPSLTHVAIELRTSPDDEPKIFRINAKDYEDGSFISNLPVPGLAYQTSRSGRERVITAINTVSAAAKLVTSYRATGWRHVDGKDFWVTANGAIGAEGWIPAPSNLSGSLARFDMPMPTQDTARLRSAFLNHSAGMMDSFPDRVGAVLVGTAYRAALCPNEWSTVLSGSPGVYKTGLAALTMHHYGELWDRLRPLTSLSGNGATTNALRILLHQVKDSLAFLDDNAPTQGAEQAYKRLEDLMRMLHNAEDRPRSSRDGQEVLEGGRPRATGLITTELPPRAGASGGRRGLQVPLSRGEITLPPIEALDTLESRHARALLMSSYLQWVAQVGRDDVLLRLDTLRREFRQWVTDYPIQQPNYASHSVKIAELYAGWALMIEFLTEAEAITAEEANKWRERVSQALLVAAENAEDADLASTTGQRVRDLLRYALANGLAYASDIYNGLAPENLEARTGWSGHARTLPGNLHGEPPNIVVDWRRPDRAIHLGYVNTAATHAGDVASELVCSRTSLEATVKVAATAMADSSMIDPGTVMRALQDEGILKVSVEHRGDNQVTRRLLARTIHCEPSIKDPSRATRDKRVVLRLDEVLGGTDDDIDPDDHRHFIPPPPPGNTPTGIGPDLPPAPVAEEPVVVDSEPDPAPQGSDTPDDSMEETTVEGQDAMPIYTNAAGLTLTSVPAATGRCTAECGASCEVTFAGMHLHQDCFVRTHSRSVEDLIEDLTGPPEPDYDPEPEPDLLESPVPAVVNAPVTTPEVAQSPVAAGPAARRRDAPGRSTARPGMRAPKATSEFAASVVVVDVDGYYLPGQPKADFPFPIEHAGDLERLGRELTVGHSPMKWKTIPEAGLVVPTHAMWERLGVPTDVPGRAAKRKEWFAEISRDLPFLTKAVDSGWVFGRGQSAPALRGMTRLRLANAARGSVAIMFTPGMPQDWGLGSNIGPGAVANRLELVSDALGIPFRASPISTGLDLLKILLAREIRTSLTAAQAVDYDQVGPASMGECEPSFDWTRPPTGGERSEAFLALFDRGGSYLSTWSSLKIGVGEPERHEKDLAFTPTRAGWWLVQMPKRVEGGVNPYPDLLDPRGNRASQQVWITTPVLEYGVKELGVEPEVLASWTWPAERSKAWLKPLYEVLRDALTQLRAIPGEDSKAAQGLVKQIYKQMSGHFISTDSDTRSRPDLRGRDDVMDMHHPYAFHAMRGKARVAILHQILKIGGGVDGNGPWPVVVSNTDLIGYPTSSLEPAKAWPGEPNKLGWGLGDYKLDRSAAMVDQQEFLTGHGWAGLDHTSVER